MIEGVDTYTARRFAFEQVKRLGGIDFKVYIIAAEGRMDIASALLDRSYQYVESVLPRVRKSEGEDSGLGYIILHAGEMSNWLLVHWWAHSDIALRLLASAENKDAEFASQDHRHFHACVWEHVVIDHERHAWVRGAMQADGSAARYLADTLADGRY